MIFSNKKKVLVCGDSFSADWTVKYKNDGFGWPNLLAKEYKVTNVSKAGVSEYKILKQLQSQKLNKYDHIVISHTSPFRLYINCPHPIHKGDVLHGESDLVYPDVKEREGTGIEIDSLVYYFENYLDLDYLKDIYNLICEKIDNMTKEYNVSHIVRPNLNWEKLELYTFSNTIFFKDIYDTNKGVMNHYDDEGNQMIFERISNEISNQ